jgi:hypothetical protein
MVQYDRVFQKELKDGIPNVTVWRVLRNPKGVKIIHRSIS